MSRKTAREAAMTLLYQRLLGGDGVEETLFNLCGYKDLTEEDIAYVRDIIEGVGDGEALDKLVDEHASGWTSDRISRVDLSILRLALYEMLHRDDIPGSVSINEAVELAKRFSTEEAGGFVNGILGGVLRAGGIKG